MTVCIGALCASPDGRESGAAVVAADRMVTLGRITEFEHDVPKITTVADRVVALTSGDALRGAELARALVASLPSGDRALETVARVAVERYVELRRRQVEVEVFSPRGSTMADFYGGLQQRFVPPLAGSIDQQVTSFNYGADLLIAGVDEHGAHLYHVHHPGDLSDFARIGFVETTLRAYGPVVFDRWFDTIRVARFASSQRLLAEEPLQRTAVAFGDRLVLVGHSAIPLEIHPPITLRIVTRWRLDQPVDGQIKLFVHLADDDLRPVRQVDKLLLSPGSPVGVGGQPQTLVDAAELALDESLAPGMYRLLLGVYHAPDGPRLRTHPDNRDFIELGHVIVGPPSSSSEARERCC